MKWLTSGVILCLSTAALAGQPVMNMAPRWDGGYGFQTRLEHFNGTTTTWLEGVYTWDKSIRATIKMPFRGGELADVILGLPLKRYKNEPTRTSNWGVTPSVQLPASSAGEWDWGLSVSYSAETTTAFQFYDLYAWEDRAGLDVSVGLVDGRGRGSGFFWLWDVAALTTDRDGDRILTGPSVVYFKRNVMLRAEYRALAYERDSTWSGSYFGAGIGVVY